MSLNKFKSSTGTTNGTQKGRDINLEIGASKLHIKDEALIDTADGQTYNLTTPTLGTINTVLKSDGAGNTFWGIDAGVGSGIAYNGTNPTDINRHIKLSSVDGSSANESIVIEDATDIYKGSISASNKYITDADLTNLETKTQNITLSTVAGETFIEGKINIGVAPNNYILPASSIGGVDGDMLTFNATTKEFDFENQNLGTVTQVEGGTGLTGLVTTSGTLHIDDTGVVADSYTSANITVNAQGQILTASNGNDGTVHSITAGTGLTPITITDTGTINIANTGVVADSYTSANITVNAQGQITSASNGTPTDLTDLETKTQNIDLTTSPNLTVVNGNIDATTFTQAGVPVITETIVSTSTGLITGGLTTLATATTVDITGGSGVINYNDIITNVSWTGITSPVLTAPINFVYVDTLGVISINQIPPTAEKMRSDIFLSAISVEGGIITDILHPPMPLENQAQTIYDFARSLGIFNMSANVFTFNGANLNIDKSGLGSALEPISKM
jgi:hypothetical protein